VAHLFVPQPTNTSLPVFFNVDGVVGAAPAANAREDVLLVQFFLKMIGDSPSGEPDAAAVTTACKKVKLTGTIDAETIAAITADQAWNKKQYPTTVVDGRVSPAKGYCYSAGTLWSIVGLNKSAQKRHKGNWPRIDKVAGCPDELKAMVKRTLIGT
jgi:hypothetical protein